MSLKDDDGDAWFAPQRYGYGAGRPISWQGWAVLAGYLLLIAATGLLARYSWIAVIGILLAATAALTLVCARTTRGGWRWRWGDKESRHSSLRGRTVANWKSHSYSNSSVSKKKPRPK